MKLKHPLRHRLSKDEKRQALEEIREYEQTTDHTAAEVNNYNQNWFYLKDDHRRRLNLNLRHIGELELLDMINSDILEDAPRLADYLMHYNDMDISLTLREIQQAKSALEWLQKAVMKEQANRRQQHNNIVQFTRR